MRRPRFSSTFLSWGLVVALVALVSASFNSETRAAEGQFLLERIGLKRGVCLVLSPQDAALPVELARESELTVYVESVDAGRLAALRQAADESGLLGTRLYVAAGRSGKLNLADNVADAVVATTAALNQHGLSQDDVLAALHPGGKLLLDGETLVKPRAEGEDDWSHPYHGPDNNPQSQDTVTRAPYLTQFLATPWYSPMPEVTVSAGGRLFKAFGHIAIKEREWPLLHTLVAMNGYNGTELWRRKLDPTFMIHRNTIIATPEVVYLADSQSCKVLDAATGALRDEITLPEKIAGGGVWKWMALQDGVLYALLGEKEYVDPGVKGGRTQAGWPWSGLGEGYALKDYPWGFGRTLVALQPETKKVLWSHTEKEDIDSRAVCMNRTRIFIYSHKKFLGALDAASGEVAWRTTDEKILAAIGDHDKAQNPRLGFASSTYAKCSEKAVYFAGPQRHRMVAVSAADGKFLWDYEAGNYQLVLRDDGLYAMGRNEDSKKFDPLTGDILADLNCYRGNCTRATGTVDSIFSRGHPHTGTMRLDLTSAVAEPTRIPLMRPACQDGVLVSSGNLYWGPWMCDCNLQLVGIISLTSAGGFDFDQTAKNEERLTTFGEDFKTAEPLEITSADWPTYRADNQRSSATTAKVRDRVQKVWEMKPELPNDPAAPIAVGELVFVSGSDGAIRALDAKTGQQKWAAYTSGAIKYPPSVSEGRLLVGSCDGYVYAFEAATGRPLWKFRAAPDERVISVYGSLSSTWPVASGTLVDDGAVFAAAGIASYDGTHVYALDSKTGEIRWQNNESGNLVSEEGRVAGVSVQGHLLLNDGQLYMPGGNVVSPAKFDAQNGKCLNDLDDEWTKAARGRELFLVDGQVHVFDQLLYSPKKYQQGRYFSQGFFVQAGRDADLVRGVQNRIVKLDPAKSKDGQPAAAWGSQHLSDVAALAVVSNAALAAGKVAGEEDRYELAAFNLQDGQILWKQQLPAVPASWGLAVGRGGQVLVALEDGRLLCFQ